jgi:KDO2-lipid IV(A) lauroyltransferase
MTRQLQDEPDADTSLALDGRFLHPRYWGTWVVLGSLRLTNFLPYAGRVFVGRIFGDGMFLLMSWRKHIARINLRLCFPELSYAERERVVRDHFRSLGVAFIEMGAAWWVSDRRLEGLLEVEGLEHLSAALDRGRGAILLSAHFTCLEMALRLFSRVMNGYAIYRPQNNLLLDRIIKRARTRQSGQMFSRGDVRTMLGALKENKPVWYPPDQDYGRRHSVFVDFFGQPAATITTTSRFAKMSGAPVIPFYCHRLSALRGYKVVLHPPLEEFPSGDEVRDARTVNAVLESEVRKCVDQYLWVHRRFKTRPDEGEDLYAS